MLRYISILSLQAVAAWLPPLLEHSSADRGFRQSTSSGFAAKDVRRQRPATQLAAASADAVLERPAEVDELPLNAPDSAPETVVTESGRQLSELDARVLRELLADSEVLSSSVSEALNANSQQQTESSDSAKADAGKDPLKSQTLQFVESLSASWGGILAKLSAGVESAAIAVQNKIQLDVATVLGVARVVASRANYDTRRALAAATNSIRPGTLLLDSNPKKGGDLVRLDSDEADRPSLDFGLGLKLVQLGVNPFEDVKGKPEMLKVLKDFEDQDKRLKRLRERARRRRKASLTQRILTTLPAGIGALDDLAYSVEQEVRYEKAGRRTAAAASALLEQAGMPSIAALTDGWSGKQQGRAYLEDSLHEQQALSDSSSSSSSSRMQDISSTNAIDVEPDIAAGSEAAAFADVSEVYSEPDIVQSTALRDAEGEWVYMQLCSTPELLLTEVQNCAQYATEAPLAAVSAVEVMSMLGSELVEDFSSMQETCQVAATGFRYDLSDQISLDKDLQLALDALRNVQTELMKLQSGAQQDLTTVQALQSMQAVNDVIAEKRCALQRCSESATAFVLAVSADPAQSDAALGTVEAVAEWLTCVTAALQGDALVQRQSVIPELQAAYRQQIAAGTVQSGDSMQPDFGAAESHEAAATASSDIHDRANPPHHLDTNQALADSDVAFTNAEQGGDATHVHAEVVDVVFDVQDSTSALVSSSSESSQQSDTYELTPDDVEEIVTPENKARTAALKSLDVSVLLLEKLLFQALPVLIRTSLQAYDRTQRVQHPEGQTGWRLLELLKTEDTAPH